MCSVIWVEVNIFGQGPYSVNIMKQLYNHDYYCAKITIDDYEIYFRLHNTLENARTAKSIYFCSVTLNRDMDIDKILFTLSYVKHKQFDCSLQVNRKSIKKKLFPVILKK